MTEISDWLADLGLNQYATIFAENAIDREVLSDLNDDDLEKLGVPLGHRKKILRAIAALEQAQTTSSDAGSRGPRPSEAERRHLTVMFCDLVGYTSLSRQLDPEDLRHLIHAYQDCCAGIVSRLDGFTARFLGDGILVYFGFPKAHEDDAERAVRAGLRIINTIKRLRPHGEIVLQVRIGIASGLVIVGDMTNVGAVQEYSVVGETPNVAARLQALAEPDSVIIEPTTHRLTEGLFDCSELGLHRLKGLAEPVRLWSVTGERSTESRFEARHGRGLLPLVGRERQLTLLGNRWRRARDGEGQVVLLSGEAGIGKSRLLQAFLQSFANHGSAKLRYDGSPHHESSALYPFLVQLSRAAGLLPDDGPDARLAKLQALMEGCVEDSADAARLIAGMLSPPDEQYTTYASFPQDMTERTLQVILGQVTALSRDRPVIVVVEDAHWLDPSSLELLNLIISKAAGLRLLLVATFRSDFAAPLQMHPWVSRLELNRLHGEECKAIIREAARQKELPPSILEEIIQRTDGVPLFVEELTKALLETGLLADRGDHYELLGELPDNAIPNTLRGALLARLDRFPNSREVAQIGAAIGREFSYQMLRPLLPLSETELHAALDHLVRSEILSKQDDHRQPAYRFKHALVQDTAYETLLRSKRQELHGRIAALLEQQLPGTAELEPELLAHHYTRAKDVVRAIDWRLRAGNLAIARSAMSEAITQLHLGLDQLSDLPADADARLSELRLQIALGTALRAAKGTGAPETGTAWDRAAALCTGRDDDAFLLQARYGQFLFHHVNVHLEVARRLGGELIELGQGYNDGSALLRGYSAVGRVAFAQGDLLEARSNLEQALTLAQGSHPCETDKNARPESLVLDLAYLSWTLFMLGHPGKALMLCDQSIDAAKRFKQPYDLVLAYGNACYLHQFRRDVPAVLHCAQEVVTLASEMDFPAWLALGRLFEGWALAQSDLTGPGIDMLTEAIAEHRATGDELEVPYFLGLLADVLREAGRNAEARSVVEEAFSLLSRTGERWFEAELCRIRAKLLLGEMPEDPRAATRELQRALDIAQQQHARLPELRAACDLAELWIEQGRTAQADALLRPIRSAFAERESNPDLELAERLLRQVECHDRSAQS